MRRRFDSHPSGHTLVETVVAVALFGILMTVCYGALQSMRTLSAVDATQIDLQENARQAIEKMSNYLRQTGRVQLGTTSPNLFAYPRIYTSEDNNYFQLPYPHTLTDTGPDSTVTANYNAINNPNAYQPKLPAPIYPAPPMTVNNGNPRLPSDFIIFAMPLLLADGITPSINAGTYKMDWDSIAGIPVEYGFYINPGPDGVNQLEYRNSRDQANGAPPEILGRHVDRLQIQDYTSDPSLTYRQLRITIYMTRFVPVGGSSNANDDYRNAQSTLLVSFSTVVEMKNTPNT